MPATANTTANRTKAEQTRTRLLDTAEELIDAEGLDRATVARITTAAQQRNAAAVHYHFGGREGLLDALVKRHHDEIDLVRARALADKPIAERDVGSLIALVVEPLVAKLATSGGRAFLSVLADRFIAGGDVGTDLAPSMADVTTRLLELLPDAASDVRGERARLAMTMVTVRLGHEAANPTSERHALSSTLINAVTAVLSSS